MSIVVVLCSTSCSETIVDICGKMQPFKFPLGTDNFKSHCKKNTAKLNTSFHTPKQSWKSLLNLRWVIHVSNQSRLKWLILIFFYTVKHMDLDSGPTGLQYTRLLPGEGPSSCSSWSRLVRQLTSWPLTPSPPSMRPVFRDRPSVPGYCWMLGLRWVDDEQKSLFWWNDWCVHDASVALFSRWMHVTLMAALHCAMLVLLEAWNVWNCC